MSSLEFDAGNVDATAQQVAGTAGDIGHALTQLETVVDGLRRAFGDDSSGNAMTEALFGEADADPRKGLKAGEAALRALVPGLRDMEEEMTGVDAAAVTASRRLNDSVNGLTGSGGSTGATPITPSGESAGGSTAEPGTGRGAARA